jgi:hypothetical protein
VGKLLLTAFALGLPSLDITAALLAAGALGAGARVRALMAFGCLCILGTIVFGTALSLIVGPRIAGIDWGMMLPHSPTEDRVAAFVDIVLALSLDHERVVLWVQTLFARVSPWMVRLITSAVLLVGSLLLLDAFWFYVTGELFVPA